MSDKPESSKTQLEEHLIQPLFQKDFLSQLPGEIAYRIIAYLAPCDLTVCAGVSRAWQRICEDGRTWQKKCLEKGYVKFDAPSFRFLGGWAANRANEEARITICSHMTFQEARQNRREREIAYGQCYERSSWKSLYLRKQRIISNWRSRPIQASTVLKASDDHAVYLLQVQSGLIVTGANKKLQVWNVDDAQPAFTLTGHRGFFYASQVSDDGKYIVSGSTDRTVRVWCGQTGAQLHVLRGHTGAVECMSLHGTTLVSGSSDKTLRVWDLVDGKCLHILTGHLAAFACCVQFDGKRVVFCGHAFTVKVWNVQTGQCLHTLTGHRDRVYSLLFEPERDLVVSGSRDGKIRVWDVRRGTCIAILRTHQIYCSDFQLRGNVLVSCYCDRAVGIWDIRDGGSFIHRLQDANGHTSYITSLQWLDSGLLVTGSRDGSVKLWDVDKGTFVRDLVRLRARTFIQGVFATETFLLCAIRSRDRTENGKLILIDFDASYP